MVPKRSSTVTEAALEVVSSSVGFGRYRIFDRRREDQRTKFSERTCYKDKLGRAY